MVPIISLKFDHIEQKWFQWQNVRKFNGSLSYISKNLWNTVHRIKIICANRHDFLFHRWTFFPFIRLKYPHRSVFFFERKNYFVCCDENIWIEVKCVLCAWIESVKKRERETKKWTMKFEVAFFSVKTINRTKPQNATFDIYNRTYWFSSNCSLFSTIYFYREHLMQSKCVCVFINLIWLIDFVGESA